jgi:lipopolysaccharide/colanic/teichoic acid biosynthesis glycosyltransferase
MPVRHIRWFGILADIAAIPLSVFLAYVLRYGHKAGSALLHPGWAPLLIIVAALVSWLGLYEFLSLDCFREGWCLRTTITRVILAAAIQMSVILALAYAVQLHSSRFVLAAFEFIFCSLTLLTRLIAYRILLRQHRAGRIRRAIIIGEGRIANELAQRIRQHPELLYEVIGLLNPFLTPGDEREGNPAVSSKHLNSLDVMELFAQKQVTELFVCLDHSPNEFQTFLGYCRERDISVHLLPQPYELFSSRVKLLEIDGVPLISLEGMPNSNAIVAFKRTADLLLGLVLAVLSFPILLVSALLLRLQGHRFLRRELRCGQFGKCFWMYRLDVDRWATNTTPFQRFLCRISISELPQLWNVIQGQMSLVGPRPEPQERVSAYSDWERQRLMVKPGITGLAQVNGLREQHSSEEKARYDLQYIVQWTPVTDLILLLETIWALAARSWSVADKKPAPAAKANDDSALSQAPTN